VATTTGFVVAYREQTLGDGSSTTQLRTAYLEPDGTMQVPKPLALGSYDSSCRGTAIPDDGVGIAFDPVKAGLVAVSVPACGDAGNGAGPIFVTLASNGSLSNPVTALNPSWTDFTLAHAHSLSASYSAGQDFEVAFTQQQKPGGAFFTFNKVPSGMGLQFLGGTPSAPASFAVVSSSSALRAFLVGLPDTDAGPSTQVYVGDPTSTANGSLTTTLPGQTATAAAGPTGGIAAALNGGGLVWATFTGSVASPSMPFAAPDGGAFLSLDVAASNGDTVEPYVLAAGLPQDVALVRTDASGTIVSTPLSSLASTSRVLSTLLSPFDGSHVALASANGIIAVAWLTRHGLQPGDPTGAWVLLSCQ
jgi:hypothetical protein